MALITSSSGTSSAVPAKLVSLRSISRASPRSALPRSAVINCRRSVSLSGRKSMARSSSGRNTTQTGTTVHRTIDGTGPGDPGDSRSSEARLRLWKPGFLTRLARKKPGFAARNRAPGSPLPGQVGQQQVDALVRGGVGQVGLEPLAAGLVIVAHLLALDQHPDRIPGFAQPDGHRQRGTVPALGHPEAHLGQLAGESVEPLGVLLDRRP